MLLTKGTSLQERYLIVRKIGEGGMGAVYKAKDQRLGQRVALKRLLHNNNPQLQQAFEREGRLLVRLRHPALPNVSDHFVEDNSQFLVMEYIPGDDLKESLEKQGPFPIPQVLDWADQLLDVLEYLHGEQPPIIHRDIKPANIKLSPRGKIILLDFGISKGGQIYSGHLPVSDDKSFFSFTKKYAPPEQMNGTGTDERSDLYSLGVTLYELLTKKEPISALSYPSARNRQSLSQQDNDPQSFDNLVKNHPDLPAGVLDVLARAMALDPNERPSNAKEMREMLQGVSRSHAQNTLVPTEPLTDRNNDRPFSGQSLWLRRGIVAAVGIVGIVLVLLIAIRIWPPTDPMFTFECANGNSQRVFADDRVTLAPDDQVNIELNITPKTWDPSSGTIEFMREKEFAYRVPLDVDLVNIDFRFDERGPTTLVIVVSDQGGLCGS